jgi:oligopeptide transport system substrate-binding protein
LRVRHQNTTQQTGYHKWRAKAGAAFAVVLALAVGSCSKEAWERPKGLDIENRILTIGNSAEPLSLDPHKASGQWERNIISNVFLGLTEMGAKGEILPGMATSWTTSADGLVWTFTLRDATWSDGVPVTADDFVFGFRRLLDPDTIAEYANIQYIVKNAEQAKKGEVPVEQIGVRAIDAKTVEFTLEHPAPYFADLLKHYTAYPIPRHVVAKYGDDWIKPENVVSNGAYTIERYWANYMVQIVKNPRFYDAQNVCFREIYYYPTQNQNTAMRRIRRGEIAWNTAFPGSQKAALDRDLPGWVNPAPYLLLNYFSLNTTKAPFNDPRVRRAINMVIDREFIATEILRAGEVPAYGFVPPGMAGYPVGAQVTWKDWPMERRRAEAKRLLEEAGYGPQKPLTFTFSHRNTGENPRIAPVVQRDWEAIAEWVQVTLAGTETQIHYANLRAKNYIAGDGGWIGDFNDAKNYLNLMETRTGPQNYPGYSNPKYDALMLAADNEPDANKRYRMMFEAEQMMLNDDPSLPIYFGTSKNIVDPRITGFYNNLEDGHTARWMCAEGLKGPFNDNDLLNR